MLLHIRVVNDEGYDRIHKEKKVQRVKGFYFYSPKGGKGLGAEIFTGTSTSTEGLRL